MSRTLSPPRRNPGRCRPVLERLESRLALSLTPGADPASPLVTLPFSATDTTSSAPLGPNLSVVATDPGPGTSLTASPNTITVTFDRALDPTSLFIFDISLDMEVGGAWVSAWDSNNPPAESLDATGTRLILSVPSPLTPGHYRLTLPEGSLLTGLDGSSPAATGSEQVLGEFAVSKPGVTLSGATFLGSPASGDLTASGALDLAADPGAARLYQFTLPPGHHWRLGSEVVAQRDGSALASTLTLFDARGGVIATSSLGTAGAPNDAYLFSGLDAGTYYLGVSGRGNIPGQAGGYDPRAGQTGTPPQAQNGGAFRLNLVADAADTATRVLGSALNHADPLDPRPTGITLAFSGLLDPGGLRGATAKGLVLVGQGGRTYPVTTVGMRESSAQYDFTWGQMLPAGHYTVRALDPGAGGLTDLAGRTPVARGLGNGVLAAFDVGSGGALGSNPNNVGPVFSGNPDGVGRSTLLRPGTASSYRFVALADGFYQMDCNFSGRSLTVSIVGSTLRETYAQAEWGGDAHSLVFLKAGVYYLQVGNDGATAESVSWDLSTKTSAESLLMNGVGQDSALSLRLVNPSVAEFSQQGASVPFGPVAPGPVAGPTVPGGTAGASGPTTPSPGESPAPAGTSSPAAQPGLYLTLGDSLVGRPTTEAGRVSVVGPVSAGGGSALASSGQGLPLGIDYGRSTAGGVETEAAPSPGTPAEPPAVNGAIVAAETPIESPPDRELIATADLVSSLGTRAMVWVESLTGGSAGTEFTEATAESIASSRDDAPNEEERVEQAQIGSPLIFGAATVMAFQYCPPLRRWLVRTRNNAAGRGRFVAGNGLRGPHRRV